MPTGKNKWHWSLISTVLRCTPLDSPIEDPKNDPNRGKMRLWTGIFEHVPKRKAVEMFEQFAGR